MKGSDLVIHCKCFLISKALEDIGVPTGKGEEARLCFLVSEIESVRECMDDDGNCKSDTECLVYLKSGNNFIIDMSYDKVLDLWLNNI